MKRFIQSSLVLLILLSACDTTVKEGQEKEEAQETQPVQPKEETIVGKWKVTKNEVGEENLLNNKAVLYSFKSNGSFILTVNNEKTIGEWSVYEDNSLVISFFDKKAKTIQGTYEISDSRLIIKGMIDDEATLIELIKAKNMSQ